MGYELYIFYIGGIHALLDPLGFKMDLSGDMGYTSFILEGFMHYWIPWVSKCSKWTSVEIWVIHLLYWRDSCTTGSLGFQSVQNGPQWRYGLYIFYIGGIHALLDPLGFTIWIKIICILTNFQIHNLNIS